MVLSPVPAFSSRPLPVTTLLCDLGPVAEYLPVSSCAEEGRREALVHEAGVKIK